MIYLIEYSCCCGDEYEVISTDNEDKAWDYAYDCAVRNYESYEGYHGILDWSQVKEEYNLEDDYEVDIAYREEIESTIDYSVIPYDETNEFHVDCLKEQGGEIYEI